MRQTGAESRAETRAEQRQRRGRTRERRQRRNQSEGRDETRLERETQSERENTSNDSQMLELVRRALLYRKSVIAAVMLHVESDLHEHANGRRKRRTSSTSGAAHSSSSRAWLHNARACDNTAYISNDLMNMLAIFCLAILLHDDIIDWRYFAGDISSVNRFHDQCFAFSSPRSALLTLFISACTDRLQRAQMLNGAWF